MKYGMNFFLFVMFLMSCSFASKIDEPSIIVYSFKTGKIQCSAEIDAQGKIAILLKPLTKNTEVRFKKIEKKSKNKILAVATVLVEEDTAICRQWLDIQEVTIDIQPKSVEETTLTGEIVYQQNNITVMVEKHISLTKGF